MILEKTMNEMPNSFTSNEFNKRAVKNGYPAKSLKRKGLASFIRKYADNAYEGSKTWVKRNKTNRLMSDEEMIEHLKNKGYKIMKPVNEWVEC
ncbi:MAG: hypothetical protein CMB97_08140 [Flavobacteriaceae bacterium]|nr:hypothetical protein [Flavobacteriaceae bacterium]|tara:strand:+ start:332 stop:610 length:279 start_codon:yes stop_codon:yes gene_type:complete